MTLVCRPCPISMPPCVSSTEPSRYTCTRAPAWLSSSRPNDTPYLVGTSARPRLVQWLLLQRTTVSVTPPTGPECDPSPSSPPPASPSPVEAVHSCFPCFVAALLFQARPASPYMAHRHSHSKWGLIAVTVEVDSPDLFKNSTSLAVQRA